MGLIKGNTTSLDLTLYLLNANMQPVLCETSWPFEDCLSDLILSIIAILVIMVVVIVIDIVIAKIVVIMTLKVVVVV